MLATILLTTTIIAFAIYVYKFPPTTKTTNNKICMDYSGDSMSELDINLVQTMVNGYKGKQLKYIEDNMKMDAHSIWFDLETLKKFIYHTEINVRNTDPKIDKKDLGLRIYYANYPEQATWGTQYPDLADLLGDPITSQYSHLHTLVAIPTLNNGKHHVDFNPKDSTTYNMPFNHPESPYNTHTRKPIPALTITTKTTTNNTTINTAAQNHGSLIPPADGSGEGI